MDDVRQLFRSFVAYGAAFYLVVFALVESFVAEYRLRLDGRVAACVAATVLVAGSLYRVAFRRMTRIGTDQRSRLVFDGATVASVLVALVASILIVGRQALQVALLSLSVAYALINIVLADLKR